jgi:hypothetical protein
LSRAESFGGERRAVGRGTASTAAKREVLGACSLPRRTGHLNGVTRPWGGCMGEERRNRAEPLNPWVRVLIALIALGVGVYGVSCLILGRLVTEGLVLEGIPARVVGATLAALAALTLVRTFYPRGRKH